MSTPHEAYRAQVPARTPDGEATRVIVTRQSGHRTGRIWLTLHGSWRGTVCLADDEVDQLTATMIAAKAAR